MAHEALRDRQPVALAYVVVPRTQRLEVTSDARVKIGPLTAQITTINTHRQKATGRPVAVATVFAAWLKVSKANDKDAVFVFSVGGGNLEKNVSANIVAGLKEAKLRGTKVFGVVGRDGGYTKQVGDCVIVIPTVDAGRITPHTEAFHAVVWHCLVSHPALQQISTKW